MKKFIVPVLSICFFISCSSDDNTISNVSSKYTANQFSPKNIINVANIDNQYDYAGKFHAEILKQYLLNHDTVNSVQTIINHVNSIALNNTNYLTLASPYVQLSLTNVQPVINTVGQPATIINGHTELSSHAKLLLQGFIDDLDNYEDMVLDVAIKDIKDFEVGVTFDDLLKYEEKQIILVTTSVTRHTLGASNPRKRSWVSTKSGIVASITTASPEEASTMSVAVSIAAE